MYNHLGALLYHWKCHSRYLTTCAFYQHKQNLLLATGSNDKNVKIWHVKLAHEKTDVDNVSDGNQSVSAATGNIEADPKQSIASSLSNDLIFESNDGQSSSADDCPTTSVPLDFATDVSKIKKTTKITDWTIDQVCEWLTNMLELQVLHGLSYVMTNSVRDSPRFDGTESHIFLTQFE